MMMAMMMTIMMAMMMTMIMAKGVPDLPDGWLWDGLCWTHARSRHRLARF